MRDNLLATGTASTGADATTLSVDYQVLESYVRVKATLSQQAYKEPSEDRTRPSDALKCSLIALQSALDTKYQLLTKGAELGAEWDWQVTCTSTDAQELVDLVQETSSQLVLSADADALHDLAKSAVKAAADLAVQNLCHVVSIIKRSWDGLPCEQKQADHSPLDLVCSLGLLLSRLYACAASVNAAGTGHGQQGALMLLQQLCSKPCQLLLQESVAGYLFLFRWHEQQSPTSPTDDAEPVSPLDTILASAFDKYKPVLTDTAATSSNMQQADSAVSSPGPSNSQTLWSSLPRFVPAAEVLHSYTTYFSSFQLPVIPTAQHWREAQEVVVGWNNICDRTQRLGLPVEVDADSFKLALEALWLFAQPAEHYSVTAAQAVAAAAAAAGATPADKVSDAETTKQAAAAATTTAELNLLGMWSTFLPRLLACIQPAAAAAVGNAPAAAAADATTINGSSNDAAAAALQQHLITPAGYLLLGMLSEALMHLTLLWQQQPAAARSSLIRSVISESDLSDLARQKRVHKLLGKAKPKPNEMLVGRLLLLVRQLAAVMVDLLQLERKICDDLATTSGDEVPWCSCLWLRSPAALSKVLELLLRCPAPICPATTTLIELLMDDLWDVIKITPVMDDVITDQHRAAAAAAVAEIKPPAAVVAAAATGMGKKGEFADQGTSSAVAAAVVSCQKAVRSWQAAVSEVLLPPAHSGTTTAAAAAVEGNGRGSGKQGKSTTAKKKSSAAGQCRSKTHSPAAAAAAGGSVTAAAAAPSWMLAAAEADPCAAVGVMLTLLSRGLECAQKAYYWRWYLWWRHQQQCKSATVTAAEATANAQRNTILSGTSNSWSSSGSFLSSSAISSHSDDLDLDQDDNDGDLDDLDAAAAATIESSSPASSYASTTHMAAAAAAAHASRTAAASSSSRGPQCALWGDNAFSLAVGFTALAGPVFAFVESVAMAGQLHASEVQTVLSLLEAVSDGLHSNSLILVELHRSLLLPQYEPAAAAAAASSLHNVLATMLAKATRADPNSSSSSSTVTHTASAAAVFLNAPEPSASLDTYDAFWQQLKFSPIDQVTLSQAAAGLVNTHSVLLTHHTGLPTHGHTGCQNPSCYNMSGFSECNVKTLSCRACRQVVYCSKECQRQHWKSHKAACQEWQQQQDAEWVEVLSEEFSEITDDDSSAG